MVNPDVYASSDNQQKDKVSSLVEEFVEDLLKISGKCMDIGCGPGDITKNILLPTLDPKAVIIGTDISKNMIEYANIKYEDEKRLKFEVLDIQTENLPQKYISEFDNIFSFHTLHWCQHIRLVFENIYRMLRPNGSTIIQFVASHDVFEVIKIMAQDIRFASYISDVKEYISPFCDSVAPVKELKELLKSIGFKIHHCSIRETSFSSKNSNEFLDSILSIYPFVDDMPRDLAEEFKKTYKDEFTKRKINYISIDNQENTFVLDLYKILIIHAEKTI